MQNISASGNWDNNYMFQHLYVSEKLILDFICVFSRLEYALKVSGFARGDSKKVEPCWDCFAKKINDNFLKIENEDLKKAVGYLLESPPRKQILSEGKIIFQDQPVDKKQRTTQQLLLMIRRVRNNLFHGGKYCPDGEKESGRNEDLLNASLI
ncbi:hypothetical protein B5637_004398, partial [Salmonella enterica subsp. enterica serovar Kiambu]|nr:hypothetical protein [Salmonella enterica subsp. enterica serovar Kiambu]